MLIYIFLNNSIYCTQIKYHEQAYLIELLMSPNFFKVLNNLIKGCKFLVDWIIFTKDFVIFSMRLNERFALNKNDAKK